MRNKLKVLFFGRKNDIYTNKIEKFLKKKKLFSQKILL